MPNAPQLAALDAPIYGLGPGITGSTIAGVGGGVVTGIQAIQGGSLLELGGWLTGAGLGLTFGGLPIIGVPEALAGIGLLSAGFAQYTKERKRVRQVRREFKRKLSKFAGAEAVAQAGIHLRPRAARLGTPGLRALGGKAPGFRLPVAVAAEAAWREAAGRLGRRALGTRDLPTLIRGFGVGPEAERLRGIERAKIQRQRLALLPSAVPQVFTRRTA